MTSCFSVGRVRGVCSHHNVGLNAEQAAIEFYGTRCVAFRRGLCAMSGATKAARSLSTREWEKKPLMSSGRRVIVPLFGYLRKFETGMINDSICLM